MLGTIRISHSDPYYRIVGMDYLYTMAGAMKSCHVFKASTDGYLYGVPEEGYSLHRVAIPTRFVPPIDFIFRWDMIDKMIMEENRNFLYFPVIPWMMLPESLERQATNYSQALLENEWFIVNDLGVPEPEAILLYKPETDKAIFMPILGKTQEGFRQAFLYTNPPILIENINEDPTVIAVANTKVSQGRRFLYINTNQGYFGMHVFRNLFNVNKNDTMNLLIYPRRDYPNLFISQFQVIRKNNPMKVKQQEYNFYDPSCKFIIDIFVQYMNLS